MGFIQCGHYQMVSRNVSCLIALNVSHFEDISCSPTEDLETLEINFELIVGVDIVPERCPLLETITSNSWF